MTPRFCPRCHRLVEIPAFLRQDNVEIKGTVTLMCGHCRKGKVMIRPEPEAR